MGRSRPAGCARLGVGTATNGGQRRSPSHHASSDLALRDVGGGAGRVNKAALAHAVPIAEQTPSKNSVRPRHLRAPRAFEPLQ